MNMPQILIIGDDMTGVNSSAVLLARQGLRCATFYEVESYVPANNEFLDTVVISTDSRSVEPQVAYDRVATAMKATYTGDIKLINKRIDSTLRGNIGAELQAIRDNLPHEALSLVVPVFPSSGRVCIGGYLMVNQVPLERTDVAKDPKNPITSSKVVSILAGQMSEPIGFIELGQVLQGEEVLTNVINRKYQEGYRVVVVDATTDEDVAKIARAAKNTGIPLIAVDPGPLTGALAAEVATLPPKSKGQKVMITVGSVSDQTRRQLETLRLDYSNKLVMASPLCLIDPQKRDAEIERVVTLLLENVEEYEVLGVVTSVVADDVLDIKQVAHDFGTTADEASQRISQGLAVITRKTIEKLGSIGGLFASGGDVAVSVSKELGAVCFEVRDQVLPLAVYGRIHQGLFDRHLVTKGGLIGNDDAISECVGYLLMKISTENYKK